MPLLQLLLALHVSLAIALLAPSILLPFVFHGRGTRAGIAAGVARRGSRGRIVRFLLRVEAEGALIIGAGLAISGIGLLAALGLRLLEQGWLLAALVLYVTTMAIAFFIQRPALRALVMLPERDDQMATTRRDRARQGRYLAYAMAGLVGTIGMLMSTKPELW